MSLYYRTLYAWKCKGTHHKLAMESLSLLEGQCPQKWRDLFLKHIESYLTGSKDPDKKFKDFRNHVLHVGDNYWGGAIKATTKWYAEARQAFADRRWKEGVYATGVMSHYLTDVCCPLHTAQSDKENIIHRACEWSVSCSYDELIDALEEDLEGFPELKLSEEANWLEQILKEQAGYAHSRYEKIVDGYRFDLGAKNPPAGLEDDIFKEFALLLGRAASSLSLVIAKCLEESGQTPPSVSLSMPMLLSGMSIPVFWVTKKMADSEERAIVHKIYDELQQTGSVEKSLPEENKVIRDLVQEELTSKIKKKSSAPQKPHVKVRQKTEPPQTKPPQVEPPKTEKRPQTTKQNVVVNSNLTPAQEFEQDLEVDQHLHSEPETTSPFGAIPVTNASSAQYYLQTGDPIVDAPSIGPKTASRLRKVNLNRVNEFLDAEADDIANRLNTRWITPELVTTWQQQSRLMCTVPGLRGHDAQILTGVGIESNLDLAELSAEDLLPLVEEFTNSSEGQRVLRSSKAPDEAEVSKWISDAREVLQNKAA